MTRRLFLTIPFVFHIPLTIGCSNRHFSIASLISGVDRLEVINSAVNVMFMVRYIRTTIVLFFVNVLLLNHHPFGEVACDSMIT